uniref:ARAD1C26180p n=1 Tax=Blastobotrys adeninivorans TaxID=409370 RepID=A0A060T818_BLAAD
MSLIDLPNEVLDAIIDYVPYKYLTSVLFTCSRLKEFALRRLWEHVNISLDSPPDVPLDLRGPNSGYKLYVLNSEIGSGYCFRGGLDNNSYICRQGWVEIDVGVLDRGAVGLDRLGNGPFKYVRSLSIIASEDANVAVCNFIMGLGELAEGTAERQYAEFLSSLGHFFPHVSSVEVLENCTSLQDDLLFRFVQRQFPNAVFHISSETLHDRLPLSVNTPGLGTIQSLILPASDELDTEKGILATRLFEVNLPALRILHLGAESTTLVSSQKLKRFFDNCRNLRILTMWCLYSSDYSLEWIPESVTHLTLGGIADPAVEPQENHYPRKVLAKVTDFCLLTQMDIPFFDAEMPNIRHLKVDCFTSRNKLLINSMLSPSSQSIRSLISEITPYEVLNLITGALKGLEEVVVAKHMPLEDARERMMDFVERLHGLKTISLTFEFIDLIQSKKLLRLLATNNPALKEIVFTGVKKEVALSLGRAIPLNELKPRPDFLLAFGVYLPNFPDERMQNSLGVMLTNERRAALTELEPETDDT